MHVVVKQKSLLWYKLYASERKQKHALDTSFAMSVLCNYGSKLFITIWLCSTRTGNYQIHEFDWRKTILTAVSIFQSRPASRPVW